MTQREQHAKVLIIVASRFENAKTHCNCNIEEKQALAAKVNECTQ